MIYAWLLSFSVMLLLLTYMVKFDQPLFALWIIVEKMPRSLKEKKTGGRCFFCQPVGCKTAKIQEGP